MRALGLALAVFRRTLSRTRARVRRTPRVSDRALHRVCVPKSVCVRGQARHSRTPPACHFGVSPPVADALPMADYASVAEDSLAHVYVNSATVTKPGCSPFFFFSWGFRQLHHKHRGPPTWRGPCVRRSERNVSDCPPLSLVVARRLSPPKTNQKTLPGTAVQRTALVVWQSTTADDSRSCHPHHPRLWEQGQQRQHESGTASTHEMKTTQSTIMKAAAVVSTRPKLSTRHPQPPAIPPLPGQTVPRPPFSGIKLAESHQKTSSTVPRPPFF